MTKGEKEILNEFRKWAKIGVSGIILSKTLNIKGVLKTNEGLYLEDITADEICQSLLDNIDATYLDIIKRNNLTDEEYEDDGGVNSVETLSIGSDYYHKSDGNIEYN